MAVPPPSPARPGRPKPPGLWAKVSLVTIWLPFPALLWVGGYAESDPRLLGLPAFYWYQLAWVVISSGLTWCAYLHTTRHKG
ncbi:DUF3311 domain-containing protein [Rhizohabitans arisaemae]|uniref:DUF3311 domain-containing protein n=1 Tax=Rhizohabitans arisaemae TaxID=2720610 RepID=UPI0024B1FE5B|nr:DUF3311 domain-containing protein [Rhizohabitans arisaemae]